MADVCHVSIAGMRETKVTVELLGRALAHEPKAVREFVKIIEPVLRWHVGRVLLLARDVCRAEVDDLCQDMLVRLLMNREYIQSWRPVGGKSFENYVGYKAQRLAKDFLRSGRERLLPDGDEGKRLEVLVDEQVWPDRRVEANDTFHHVYTDLMASLTDQGKMMFHYLFIEERSVAEVAFLMNTTDEVVYQWRTRLRERMGKIVAAMGDLA